MKLRKLLIILPLGLCLLSCDKWLDHSPFDKVAGSELYQTETGAQQALNGLYLSLLDYSAYGGSMAVVPDIMAQMYYIPSESSYNKLRSYDWTDKDVKKSVSAIWDKMYKTIAECNVFLREIEAHKDRYDQDNYLVYRGEALALRTFLHFDLFRLFGPADARDMNVLEGKYIPYYAKDSEIPTPYLTGVEFMDNLMRDIDEAIGLLAGDPVLTYGLRSGSSATEDFWDYRNFRFNIYAAWAQKARMCLHFGDTDGAYEISVSLLSGVDPDSGEGTNFWSTFTPIVGIGVPYRDPVFFSEMIFGMHNLRRGDMHKKYFSTDLEDKKILLAGADYLSGMYGEGDLRAAYWENSNRGGEKATRSFVKFQSSGISEGQNVEQYRYQIQSLIRLGELFLIAAESSDGDTEKREWLRALRIYRGMDNTNADGIEIEALLRGENIREFYGEGQLLYFYKRNGYTNIPSNNSSTGTDMTESTYRLLIPDAENDNRVN